MRIPHLVLLSLAALAGAGPAPAAGPAPGPPAANARPCGRKIAPCPRGSTCVPNDPACTDLNFCLGTCVYHAVVVGNAYAYPSCGGHRPNPPPCAPGSSCKDDPRLPGSCGLACDRPGICLPDKQPSCAGFAGLQCPPGLVCYDIPNDGCDPKAGGADCLGICL